MTHWQETGECSICGIHGSNNKGIKLTATELDGIPTTNLDKPVYYYLCPDCKKILDNGTGYTVRIESKREKIDNTYGKTSRTINDGQPLEITAHDFDNIDIVCVNAEGSITVFDAKKKEGVSKEESTYQVSTDNGKTGLPEVPANKEKIYCGESLGGVLIDKSHFKV